MDPRHLLMSLVCLGWLFAAGCTPPVEPAPTVMTTTQVPTITPSSTIIPLLTTPTPTPEPTASPLPSTPSEPEMLATEAAQATINASLPTRTPTPTWTPTPTFTPIPGPVWRILFRAVPCPPSMSQCITDLYMGQRPQWYLINSDGSNLAALKDTETPLADMYIWAEPHSSPDGTHLAYLTEPDDEVHLMLFEISSGQTSDLGVAPREFRELKFLPEPSCLAVYSSPAWGTSLIETLTVTRLCADSTERQILETLAFPSLQPIFNRYHLSPQGDALLIINRNTNNLLELYVYEFGSQAPPRLLFAPEGETWFLGGPVRWLPDGQGVEFFAQKSEPDGSVKVLLYASNRPATDIQVKLELQLPFSLLSGDWSPDGRELAFFPGMPRYTPETAGIYILDLESGVWRQIVSGFYDEGLFSAGVLTWQAEAP